MNRIDKILVLLYHRIIVKIEYNDIINICLMNYLKSYIFSYYRNKINHYIFFIFKY